jgi:hypothetical protein
MNCRIELVKKLIDLGRFQWRNDEGVWVENDLILRGSSITLFHFVQFQRSNEFLSRQ